MGCGKSKSVKDDAGAGCAAAKGGKDKEAKKGSMDHGLFITENNGKVTDSYDVEKAKLGQGSYGSVSKCVNKSTSSARAVKTIKKAQMKNSERFKQEIAIMKRMDHPNIIKLFETFEDHRNIYLIMELCVGGELFDRIIDSGHFTEVQAAMVMQHIFRAIFYMHENMICHRDLKPENFLFTTKESIEHSTLKIIDFGLAREFGPDTVLTTKAGTPYYVSPQVLSGKYDQTADLWSCGVIMYVLLCGYPPFHGDTDADVLAKVKLGNFSFVAADWKNVSEDAKNLIRMLLKLSVKERYTASQALNHIWVTNTAPKAKDVALSSGLVDNLRTFRSQNKLKKAALHVIASQMSDTQIQVLRDTFTALDDNGDGLLTATELRDGMAKAGFDNIPPDLQQILEEVDTNGTGVIDYTEFLAATLDRKMYLQEDICWAAFRVFDRDGNGRISKEEIALVLGDGDVASVAMRDIAELMQDVDQNGDGEIDFEEFMAMMRGGGGKSDRRASRGTGRPKAPPGRVTLFPRRASKQPAWMTRPARACRRPATPPRPEGLDPLALPRAVGVSPAGAGGAPASTGTRRHWRMPACAACT
eukprot:CAMPEP_0171199366 /NCGR_PEP_ID=MMETSP0790-20130122/23427_1 /TAXON_ID=2925 /ORGANISM="Alexandrium catenella, Strain OF101" /LENGTH=585 /DNA_ID=CAMNT_0011664711 /DNA_START=16 /DNA_END=1774 /DNA_ORIENTATION=-